MPKSKRAINPADALRKAQRKRELKKNKEQRREARQSALAKKNTNPIKGEIQRLENQARHTGLDKNAQARLTQLKGDLERIEKAKKTREPQLSGAQAAFYERQRQQQEREQRENRKMVYDPKTNSFVAVKVKDTGAKAGSSKARRSDDESSSSTSSSETDSDSDMSDSDLSDTEDMATKQDDKDVMNEDEDIPLPEGPPPEEPKVAGESRQDEQEEEEDDDDDDDDDDIPLPEGPPPPKPFQTQLAPIQAAQMRPPPPPPPRPPHFVPPFPGMPMAGGYGMMVPPPPPPGRPPAHAMRVPPPPPPRPPFTQRPPMYAQPPHIYQSSSAAPMTTEKDATPVSTQAEAPKPTREQIAAATISAEPQLRDLQKELLGFVPAAVRRKQAAQKKTAALPKGAKPIINAAPDVEEEQE